MALVSCDEAQEHTAPAIYDRDSVSMMVSYGVNTLISDSGVIKYKIVTERWDVNMIKQPSRWTFEKGVFFEQFDQNFHVEAYVQADTAWYYDQQKLWHLRGRVRIRNVNGLVYQSEELYWDGLKHELYSNVFSKVTTPERTTEDMTGEDKNQNSTPGDTAQQSEPILRPQIQQKHARTSQDPTQ